MMMMMWYHSLLARCGLALSILLSAAASREGDNAMSFQGDNAMSLLQVKFMSRPLTKHPILSRDFHANMLENSALLHIPYSHIAINVTYSNLGEEIITFPQRRPQEFSVMLATCKTWTADAIVQFGERRHGTNWKFDWRRSVAFALFGVVYIGFAQWFLYVSVLTWLFPDAMMFANAPMAMKLKDQTGLIDMAGQVCVDNFIFEVLIYFPVFYIIKSLIQGKESFFQNVKQGLGKYRGNMVADNLASCAIWMPADVIIFACPMYLRMPMEHLVSFGWTMFISAMRGSPDKPDVKDKLDVK